MNCLRATRLRFARLGESMLSDEQIRELAEDGLFLSSIYEITRAIEAEVRKDDEALIRQMLEALENCPSGRSQACTAGRARLEGKP